MLEAFLEDVMKCLDFINTRESLERAADTCLRGIEGSYEL